MWHATRLTRGHLKKFKKIQKEIQKNKKNDEVTCGTLLG